MAGKYDHINFKPPKSVAEEAAEGLRLRKRKGGRGGLTAKEASKQGIGSGVQRAVNLKNRSKLNPSTIRRMAGFFSRHDKNVSLDADKRGKPHTDAGYVAGKLWGGKAGRAWANKVVRQMEAADRK